MLSAVKEVTFEITNRCDLKCAICGIWKERKKRDISLKEIAKILDSLDNTLSVSLTGGEPLLHPEFQKIYRYLYRLFLRKKITCIDIATNAYSENIVRFLEENRRYLTPLTLSISLDGSPKTHDKQRGRRGAFKNTLNNIVTIKNYNVLQSIKFVATAINHQDFLKIFKLSGSLNLEFHCKLAETVSCYYHRHRESRSSLPRLTEYSHIAEMLGQACEKSKSGILERFALSCLKSFCLSGKLDFIKKCATPQKTLFVASDGNIYNCLYQEKVGKISSWPRIDTRGYKRNTEQGKRGKCPKCLSYHGYLRYFNFQK